MIRLLVKHVFLSALFLLRISRIILFALIPNPLKYHIFHFFQLHLLHLLCRSMFDNQSLPLMLHLPLITLHCKVTSLQKLILKDILLVSLKNLTDLVFLPFSLPKIVFVPTSFFQAIQVSYWQDALTNELIALEAKSNLGIRASSYQCLCN